MTSVSSTISKLSPSTPKCMPMPNRGIQSADTSASHAPVGTTSAAPGCQRVSASARSTPIAPSEIQRAAVGQRPPSSQASRPPIRRGEGDLPGAAVDTQAVAPQGGEMRAPCDEGHLMAGAGQFPAEKTAHRTRTHHRNLHDSQPLSHPIFPSSLPAHAHRGHGLHETTRTTSQPPPGLKCIGIRGAHGRVNPPGRNTVYKFACRRRQSIRGLPMGATINPSRRRVDEARLNPGSRAGRAFCAPPGRRER